MNTSVAILAAVLTGLALYLPTRTQTFTRVTVDGRSIRMLVAGRGDGTVVFENGLGGPLELWGKVQPEVSRFARSVSYDRAGVGLSDEGPLPRDGRRIATELRSALRAADIAPPYILVGASLGGAYIRIFAGMYPGDVAGMVLVDPTPVERADEAAGSRVGLPELESLPVTRDQARHSPVPGGIPVLVIDALSPLDVPFATEAIRTLRMSNRADVEAESVEYKRWLGTLSGNRARLVVAHSGHNVAQEKPGVIVETIREVVTEMRRDPD